MVTDAQDSTLAVIEKRDGTSGSPSTATTTVASSTQTNTPSQTLSSVPDAGARVNHCSVVRNSVLYVFGGQPPVGASQSSSFPLFASFNLSAQFDDSNNPPLWQELPSQYAVPVINSQCVLTDTHLLVVGGQPLDNSKANPFASNSPMTYGGLQAYSFAENGWQSLMPLPGDSGTALINLNRTGHVAEWLTDVGNGSPGLFLMGGTHFNASTPANDAFVLNPFIIPAIGGQAIIEAKSIPNNLPPPTFNSGSVVVNSGTSVLFFGGTEPPAHQSPTQIWEFTAKTSSWKQLSASLPHGLPNAKTGWVDWQSNLVAIDLSSANTQGSVCVVPLAHAGLRRRQTSPQSSPPTNMDGSSIAFDPTRNLAIISGGDNANSNNLNVFNMTSGSWSVMSIQDTVNSSPTTAVASVTPSASSPSLPTGTGLKSDSTGFNKANLLAPIILGGVLGLLGLCGIILLIISYCHRKSRQSKRNTSVSPAGLWLKYGSRKRVQTISKPIGGEIFLRNLEEKHGLKRAPSTNDRRRTAWSKYFSQSWYHGNQGNTRISASTSTTAQALVNETRDHSGPYGGGWDADSHYSKASSFVSVVSAGQARESSRWSGFRWSYSNNNKKTRASNASSGVLGSTIGSPFEGNIGAGGVNRL